MWAAHGTCRAADRHLRRSHLDFTEAKPVPLHIFNIRLSTGYSGSSNLVDTATRNVPVDSESGVVIA
jgi:hypothetical protein